LVDTSILSAVYRRRTTAPRVGATFAELVDQERVVLIGAVRQEVLSGVRGGGQFRKLRRRLRSFPELPLKPRDYERAAQFFNTCAARGVQGSGIDFLICAAASRRGLPIYTSDQDFLRFAHVLPIRVLSPDQTT
jgi:predicted nucleic acid-binding protein